MLAVALIGLGVLHFTSGHMIQNFTLPNWMPLKTVLAYLTGLALVVAAILIASKRYGLQGTYLAAAIFAIFLVFLLIPRLIMNLRDSAQYTFTSETLMFFSGALMLAASILTGSGNTSRGRRLLITGKYLFALTLLDFAVEHCVSEPFVVSIIPKWIPWKTFWAYFVMCAFFAASVSLFINIKVRLAALMLFLMFFLWVALMHLPDVLGNAGNVFSWTNLFVPIGVCGIALILAGSTAEKR